MSEVLTQSKKTFLTYDEIFFVLSQQVKEAFPSHVLDSSLSGENSSGSGVAENSISKIYNFVVENIDAENEEGDGVIDVNVNVVLYLTLSNSDFNKKELMGLENIFLNVSEKYNSSSYSFTNFNGLARTEFNVLKKTNGELAFR